MARRTVLVGKEYEKAFETVKFLIENGGLPVTKDFAYTVEGDAIVSDAVEFRLTTTLGDEVEKTTHGYGPNGATWFAGLRGEEVNNDSALWNDVMTLAKDTYHANFSIVEYRQQKKTEAELEAAEREAEEIVKKFASTFFDGLNLDGASIRPVSSTSSTEDIFGVSLRLELATEAGEPFPVLGTVYFNRITKDSGLQPIPRTQSAELNKNISEIVPDDTADGAELDVTPVNAAGESEDTIDVVLGALENLVGDKKKNLAEYICFNEDAVERIEITERQMSNGNFTLRCKRVDVLYITHIKKEAYICDLYVDNEPMLRFIMGINNRLSVRCLNCNSKEYLVVRDEMRYQKGGKNFTVILDHNEENLGLTEEQIEDIKAGGRMKSHLMTITCGRTATRPGGCTRRRCATQIMLVGDRDYCLDCPHPDVIYTDFRGRTHHVPSSVYTTDTLDFVPRIPAEGQEFEYLNCEICGRRFSRDALVNGRCKTLCARADDTSENAAAARLYKRYSGMLPLLKRISTAFQKKRCYEDETMLLLTIGREKFIFDKINAREFGYLDKPTSVKKR